MRVHVGILFLAVVGCGGRTEDAPLPCGGLGAACCETDAGFAPEPCDPGIQCYNPPDAATTTVFVCGYLCGEEGQPCCWNTGPAPSCSSGLRCVRPDPGHAQNPYTDDTCTP